MGGNQRAFLGGKAVLAIALALMLVRLAAAGVVRIGISTEDNRGTLAPAWQRVVEYLGEALPDQQFVLEPIPSDQFPAALKSQTVDAAIADPAILIVSGARAALLATPRYRFKGQEFSGCAGALVVREARADLRMWSDLRTAEIATADINSLRDWLAVHRELRNVRWAGRVRAVQSRDAALADVAAGRVEAAAVPALFLESWLAAGPQLPEPLHVIRYAGSGQNQGTVWPVSVSTPIYPGVAFVALERLSPELRRRLASALLSMKAEASVNDAEPTVVGWDPYGSDADVHAVLRDLGIPPYSRIREISLADVAREFTYIFVVAGVIAVVGLGVIITLTATNRALRAEVARRREAEKALLRSIERFEHIAACSSDWIWECDERGVYTYSNANVRAMLGFDPQEIFGRHHLDFLATMERERLAAEGRSLLDGGRRVFRETYRMRTKDGRLVVHEITAEPVRGSDGKVIGYRGVSRDITDRARAVRLVT